MKNAMIAGVAGVMLAGGLLLAGCGGHGHGMFGCCGGRTHGEKAAWVADKIGCELNLTTEQKTKLNAIKDELVKKHEEMKPEHEALQAEFKTQFLAATMDREKLDQALVSRQPRHDEMRRFLLAKLVEFHDMLTPEQRAKAVEKLEKIKAACER